MSSLATAFLAENDALRELTAYWERAKGEIATHMTIIEFLRATAQSKTRLSPPILVISGLPSLLKPEQTEENDPINHLRDALHKLSRESTILIQVEDLDWDPPPRPSVRIQGHKVVVSEVLAQDTYNLRDHIKIGATKGKKMDDYVKVKL